MLLQIQWSHELKVQLWNSRCGIFGNEESVQRVQRAPLGIRFWFDPPNARRKKDSQMVSGFTVSHQDLAPIDLEDIIETHLKGDKSMHHTNDTIYTFAGTMQSWFVDGIPLPDPKIVHFSASVESKPTQERKEVSAIQHHLHHHRGRRRLRRHSIVHKVFVRPPRLHGGIP